MSEANPLAATWSGFLMDISKNFDTGVQDLNDQLKAAQEALSKNPSDPTALAQYQAVMSEYNLYRNAQSASVKTMKEIAANTISNFR
ncbi:MULTISPECIES: type III secretion system needle complex protein [Burkholderia]|uniref:type III secretion system needle complex protein n=1 Tax=Burkholderia TaxID=32008 RepID=UPI00128E03F3|nr:MULTISPECIES: type III secretion system needle complex protein [Burkholderia]MBR8458387.1 type III secretion system needle complex protein [Burkholderia dolosa]MPV71665.1 type III secretion system needle complex protein [Burkholderia sp. BE17]